mgnify:CR=1 FL=1
MNRIFSLDLDGVCFDFIGSMLREASRRGYEKKYEDIREWSAWKTGNGEVDKDLLRLLYNPEFFRGMSPLPGAMDAVELLARHGRIVAISARPVTARAGSISACTEHFPAIKRVFHVKNKVDVMRRLHSRYLVEDDPKIVNRVAGLGRRFKVWIVDHPYNRGVPTARRVCRVGSLLEMAQSLDERIKRQGLE